jgi:hypothetical protein
MGIKYVHVSVQCCEHLLSDLPQLSLNRANCTIAANWQWRLQSG